MRLSGSGFVLLFAGLLFAVVPLQAQEVSRAELEALIKAQNERIERLERALINQTENSVSSEEQEVQPVSPVAQPAGPSVGYDSGVVIENPESDAPFQLKIRGRMQFRYTGFSPEGSDYDLGGGSSGTQERVSDFEIERGRLSFEGYALDPNLQYYIQLDFDTDDNHDVKAHDFWFNYVFADEFDLYTGKGFVPGSREWLDGSTTTRLADRSLATSFFRPDRSLGVWAKGDLEGVEYHAMVANGFVTTDLDGEDVDNDFTYAVSLWGDVLGDYGKGRADLEYHEAPAVRVGSSFTYSPVSGNSAGEPVGEADAIRLSNGLRLDNTGALAPDVTVSEFDIFLYAIDLSAKFMGLGVNSELYYRTIDSITGDGVLPVDHYDDKGAYVDIGYFVIPQLLEPVFRYSVVDGAYGDSSEFAAGINYFINGTHLNKITLDAARIEHSGVSSSSPNYTVGQDGMLYRLQWQVGF